MSHYTHVQSTDNSSDPVSPRSRDSEKIAIRMNSSGNADAGVIGARRSGSNASIGLNSFNVSIYIHEGYLSITF